MEYYLRSRLSDHAYEMKRPFRPALTISRECGAGINEIGPRLVEYLSDVDDSTLLGWALFDHEMIGKIIADHNLPKSVAPFLAEKTKFPIVEALKSLLEQTPSRWTLFNYSADTIRNLCQMGNAIIVGRAGNFITSDLDNTFHVRLVGSLEKRIQHTAARHSIPLDRAAEIVRETDHSRDKFVRRYAHSNLASPKWYHLVLNTDDILPENTARIIGDSLLEWANQKDIQSRETSHGTS